MSVLVNSDLSVPIALTIDTEEGVIFWLDAALRRLEKMWLMGGGRMVSSTALNFDWKLVVDVFTVVIVSFEV